MHKNLGMVSVAEKQANFVLRALRLRPEEGWLAQSDNAIVGALEASRFERLQRQELEQRFREAPPRSGLEKSQKVRALL